MQGWCGEIDAYQIKGKTVTVVPILRAGLGMLDGVLDLIPTAKISVVRVDYGKISEASKHMVVNGPVYDMFTLGWLYWWALIAISTRTM